MRKRLEWWHWTHWMYLEKWQPQAGIFSGCCRGSSQLLWGHFRSQELKCLQYIWREPFYPSMWNCPGEACQRKHEGYWEFSVLTWEFLASIPSFLRRYCGTLTLLWESGFLSSVVSLLSSESCFFKLEFSLCRSESCLVVTDVKIHNYAVKVPATHY